MSQSFDVVVIGAGPGGYVAAIRASQLGLKVACVERAELGGVCLNWGCIPTKALLHSAHLKQEIAHSEVHGFTVGRVAVAWDKLIARSRGVAKRLSRGVGGLFKKYGVTHLVGDARLERPGVVEVKTEGGVEKVEARHIIIATGARPRPLPGLPFDGQVVWSSKEAMVSTDAPESLLIIGAGAIGCEFAYFYNAFGTKVTLVEVADRLLPVEDDDCSAALEKSFAKQGITVKTKTMAQDLKVVDGHVEARLVSGDASELVTVDRVLVAIGVVANTDGLNLEECGVELVKGHVKIDSHGATTCPGIWAIGDVAGPPWLAHKASAEGVHTAEAIHAAIQGKKVPGHGVRLDNIPGCTYCEPQVASVGLTERAVKAANIPYKAGKFPYVGNGKALALEDKEGFAKVLFHAETGALLGAHLFGTAATELIAESVLVRQAELTEADILASVHAHPTLSEAFAEAVGLAFGHSVNL
ncbi:MAG TPA: dihydrolipoyl dehydrogenase [Myxococcota bacterium]|nr:dihydrolipoyl dehydrogenase [Myxococcota bacterium]